MVIIRFPSTEVRRRALAFLLARSPGKSWATGEVMISESAISHLAAEGITFTVEGAATYERILDLNKANSTTSAVVTA
jgi:hypothetical protein